MMPSRWRSVPATLLLMLLLATAPLPAAAQTDLEVYVNRYDELFQAGNYDAALAEARKFEAAARARYGTQHESYAGALYLQARALYVLGKYPEAEKLYKLALPIFEKAKPSQRGVTPTRDVPGMSDPELTAFKVSQALAWLARERREISEQFARMEQIPKLMTQLTGRR